MTVSHLRFGKTPYTARNCLSDANFVACHNETSSRNTTCSPRQEGAASCSRRRKGKDEVSGCPARSRPETAYSQEDAPLLIDAISLAEELGLGARINMIMQTAFFVISGIVGKDEAVKAIKKEI